jgi:hypothetical protein
MNVYAIQDVFQHWLAVLADQGVSARLAHTFPQDSYGLVSAGLNDDSAVADDLVIVTFLTSAKLDPERRANVIGHRRSGSRPLARMRYAIVVCGSAAPRQQELALLTLLTEAEAHPEIHILSDPVSDSWWSAQGLPPRPAFQLEVCVTEQMKMPPATLVKEHTVDLTRSTVVDGLVVWDDGRPISGAQVKLVSSKQTVYSDAKGCFRITVMEGGALNEPISVYVRNHVQSFARADIPTENGRWLLRVKPSSVLS